MNVQFIFQLHPICVLVLFCPYFKLSLWQKIIRAWIFTEMFIFENTLYWTMEGIFIVTIIILPVDGEMNMLHSFYIGAQSVWSKLWINNDAVGHFAWGSSHEHGTLNTFHKSILHRLPPSFHFSISTNGTAHCIPIRPVKSRVYAEPTFGTCLVSVRNEKGKEHEQWTELKQSLGFLSILKVQLGIRSKW